MSAGLSTRDILTSRINSQREHLREQQKIVDDLQGVALLLRKQLETLTAPVMPQLVPTMQHPLAPVKTRKYST